MDSLDPDPAFQVNSDPDTTKSWKKTNSWKKYLFWSKIAVYLSLGLFVAIIDASVSFLKDVKSEIFSKIVYFFFFQDYTTVNSISLSIACRHQNISWTIDIILGNKDN